MKPNADDLVDLTVAGIKIQVDPAEHWNRILGDDPEEREATVIGDMHWLVVLFGIDLPLEQKDAFWESYRDPKAEQNRLKALNGLVWVNYQAERDLLNHANWEHEQRESAIASQNEEACKMAWDGMALTGIRFAELVHSRDHKAFAKMAKILELGRMPVSDTPKGGEHSDAGQMLRHFIRLHLETRGLPTKKDLREACGLADDPKRASALMKELGLSGLPQAS